MNVLEKVGKPEKETEVRLPDPNGSVLPLSKTPQTRYSIYMTETYMTPYAEYVQAKGYTLRECYRPADQRVPARLRNRYSTYEEYQEAIADFLNGN